MRLCVSSKEEGPQAVRTCSSRAANFVFVRRSKPPPRVRCSAIATATRTPASPADSACRATWRARGAPGEMSQPNPLTRTHF